MSPTDTKTTGFLHKSPIHLPLQPRRTKEKQLQVARFNSSFWQREALW
jgi:hypothetical protein